MALVFLLTSRSPSHFPLSDPCNETNSSTPGIVPQSRIRWDKAVSGLFALVASFSHKLRALCLHFASPAAYSTKDVKNKSEITLSVMHGAREGARTVNHGCLTPDGLGYADCDDNVDQ